MSEGFDDPSITLLAPSGPNVFEGELSGGVGDTLLMKFFGDGLNGRFFLEGQPGPRGVIFMVRGEPVHAEPVGGPEALLQFLRASGEPTPGAPAQTVRATVALCARAGASAVKLIEFLRDSSRSMVRDLIAATAGTYRFKLEDPPDDLPLIAVNPFGQLIDARRRRLRPDELMRLGEETSSLIPYPRAGFASVALRIRSFTGGVDLGRVVDGTTVASNVYAQMGLPPIIGGLIFNTLAETGLIRWDSELSSTPIRETYTVGVSSGPLTMSEDALPIAELQRLPRTAHALLGQYFDIKPERDPKVLFGPDAMKNMGALERGYEARLAQIDPRIIPEGPGRPYLLARVDELRGKLERAYRQIAPEHAAAFKGAFQLLERIGVGGVAEVFRARSNEDGTIVAVKRMRAETKDELLLVRELLREARITQRIRHPNVVRILTAGKAGDEFYLAMEYVDGGDLQALWTSAEARKGGSVDVLCRLVADACGGLHAAHAARDDNGDPAPILHRDVSPHNILVTTRGEAKLSDFGIARAKDASNSDARTNPGTVRGKLPYIAPELIREDGHATVHTDVYAMGMTLCAVLGHLPFKRKTAAGTLRAILEDPLPAPSTVNPDVPPEIDAIVLRACARDPAQRYSSALELQIELEQFLARRPPLDVGGWVRAAMSAPQASPEPHPAAPNESQTTSTIEWSEVDIDF